MGLFGMRLPDHDVQENAERIAQMLRQLSPRCVEAVLKSASSYLKVHIPAAMRYVPDYSTLDLGQPADLSQIPVALQSTVTCLNTYLVWCVGAFLNGQRIMRAKERKQFVAGVWKEMGNICVQAQIDPFLSYLVSYQRDKFELAARLLHSMYSNAGLDPVVFAENAGPPPIFQIDYRAQMEMNSYHTPLVEFVAGVIGLAIDRLLRPDEAASQIEILHKYDSEVLSIYKLDTTLFWRAIGI